MVVLSEKEYERLAPRYLLEEAHSKIAKLNQVVLELSNNSICEAQNGGYCNKCILFKLNTCQIVHPSKYTKIK